MDERYIGGLWCREVLRHLDALMEGQLDEQTATAVQDHVAGCDACAAFGDAYARVVGELRAVPSGQLDADRMARLRHRLKAER